MNLVSVFMTVKNGYPYIKDAIESIRLQTYTNWELVIVDDGSTDETSEYLKSIENEDKRFKFIFIDSVGRSKALNIAVSHTNGDFIANLDADDLAHPERLEKQLNAFIKFKSIKFLCTRSSIFFNSDDHIWYKGNNSIEDVSNKLLIKNPVNHSSVMMNRSLFFGVGKYNENLSKVIDYDLWCRIFLSGNRIYIINDFLTAKRIHKRQSFENKNRINYLLTGFRIKKKFIADSKSSFLYHVHNLLNFIYGLLPQCLRMLLKNK